MRIERPFLFGLVLICALLSLASCDSAIIGSARGPKIGQGPPPHAPAHGYRRKHQGVELVYDSGPGVYVVVGFPGHYYLGGRYYRLRATQWEMSVNIGGRWKAVSVESLPPGLRGKQMVQGYPKEHPGRGRGAQKNKP